MSAETAIGIIVVVFAVAAWYALWYAVYRLLR